MWIELSVIMLVMFGIGFIIVSMVMRLREASPPQSLPLSQSF